MNWNWGNNWDNECPSQKTNTCSVLARQLWVYSAEINTVVITIKQRIDTLSTASSSLEWIKWTEIVKTQIDKIIQELNGDLSVLEVARSSQTDIISQLCFIVLTQVSETSAQLAETQIHYKALFNDINVGVWTAHINSGTFVEINEALCDILEIEQKDHKWEDYREFWSKYIIDEREFEESKNVFKESWRVTSRLLHVLVKNKETWEEKNKTLKCFSVKTKDAELEQFLVIDVTAEEEAIIAKEEAIGAKVEAMGILQHDIQSPLRSATVLLDMVFADWIADGRITADEIEGIELLKLKFRQISGYADRYLAFARMEKWTFIPNYSNIDIISMLKEVINWMPENNKFIFVDNEGLEFDYSEPIIFSWDTDYIVLVIFNLLRNALESSSDEKKIKIMITDNEDSIVLAVNNDQPIWSKGTWKIFQHKWVHSSKRSWNWIGTYSIKLIVEAHKWTIKCDSSEEDGTTIELTFLKKPQVTK